MKLIRFNIMVMAGSLLCLMMSACSDGPGSGGEYGRMAFPLVGGTETDAFPEIGVIQGIGSRCAATLISDRHALTAGHCVRFKVCEEPACNLNRSVKFATGDTTFTSRVVRIHSFMYFYDDFAPTDILLRDVAVVEFEESAPADLFAPRMLSETYPAIGDPFTMIGFGCTDRCNPEPYVEGEELPKQRLDGIYGNPSTAACLGDSGGPSLDANGQVFAVTSASRVKEADDIFGDVVQLRGDIQDVIHAWQAEAWTGQSTSTLCEYMDSCERCTSRNACGWCANVGHCVYGGWDGPRDEPPACGGSDYVWGQPECPGPAWRPESVEPWNGDCSVAEDCHACTRLGLCGWSEPNGLCVRGMPAGPDDTELGTEDWFFAPYCCPYDGVDNCGDASCTGAETCATCPDDCGFCEPRCGDFRCDPQEDRQTCPIDCSLDTADGDEEGDVFTDGDSDLEQDTIAADGDQESMDRDFDSAEADLDLELQGEDDDFSSGDNDSATEYERPTNGDAELDNGDGSGGSGGCSGTGQANPLSLLLSALLVVLFRTRFRIHG